MTAEGNRELIRRWVDVVWNRGDVGASDELITGDFVNHNVASLTPVQGRDGHDAWVTTSRAVLDGWHVTLDDVVAEGDRAAARWTIRGTNRQTGRQSTVPGMHFYRFEDGKIAEMWTCFDRFDAGRQLGEQGG